jgi:hypothetical protein
MHMLEWLGEHHFTTTSQALASHSLGVAGLPVQQCKRADWLGQTQLKYSPQTEETIGP